MAWGEVIGHSLEAKREDTGTAVDVLSTLTGTVTVREPDHDEDTVQIAVLPEVDRHDELEPTVGDLAVRGTTGSDCASSARWRPGLGGVLRRLSVAAPG
jgi:hypothetical protein